MTKQDTKSSDKAANDLEQSNRDKNAKIVMGAITGFLKGESKAAVVAENQLQGLIKTLEACPEPITEKAWNKHYSKLVAQRLEETQINGEQRYSSKGARQVALNMLKAATIGITHARENADFEPSANSAKNLKKYADEVRPKLQEAGVLSGQRKKVASEDTPDTQAHGQEHFYIIGFKSDKGFEGPTAFLYRSKFLRVLQDISEQQAEHFPGGFVYLTAKDEPIPQRQAVAIPKPITVEAISGRQAT